MTTSKIDIMPVQLPVDVISFIKASELGSIISSWMQSGKPSLAFMSHGKMSAHDLIVFITQSIPGARCFICTWAITEDPARILFELKNTGRISELHLLVDARMIASGLNHIYHFCKGFADSFNWMSNHAKIILLRYDQCDILIATSANLSYNPRNEFTSIWRMPAQYFDNLENWFYEQRTNK